MTTSCLWVEFRWRCRCGKGYAIADHSRREFTAGEQRCIACGEDMQLIKRPLGYADELGTSIEISPALVRRALDRWLEMPDLPASTRIELTLQAALTPPAAGASLSSC